MKLTKLLTAASAAALIAGSASALTLTQGDADGTPITNAITSAVVVAEEASFAATGSDEGNFEFTLTSTGTFAAGENYFIDITLSGGSFAADLTGAEVTSGGGANPATLSGASVQIAGQSQTGQEGETAVRLLVSIGNTGAGDNIGLELPIAYAGCPAELGVSVNVATVGGVTFEEGTVSLGANNPAVSCGNAYLVTVASDVSAGANDSVLESSDFDTFLASVTTSDTDRDANGTPETNSNDISDEATVGVVTLAFDPDGLTPVGGFATSLDASSANITGSTWRSS